MAAGQDWPLDGLRAIDLSTEIAGPYCTKLLADAGADVVKVEAPDGDPLRHWTASGASIPAGEDGALFQYLNASKRSIVLDLATGDGRARLADLAARADLVIESFPTGTLQRLGFDLEALQSRNPALCLVSITPWGQTGPWAERPATEFTLQAATGSTAYRGLRDRKPVAAGGRIGEWAAGSFAAVGAVSAWLSARQSGVGQLVDVSTFEAMLLCMTIYHDLESQWVEGPLARAVEIPSVEPAKDGWVGFCTITGQQWVDFCTMVGREDLGQDPRYRSGLERMEHIELMHEVIHSWTRERTVDEIIDLASRMRIPVSPIGNGETLPQMDHFVERGVFVENPHGFLQPRVPYRIGEMTPRPFGRAPQLGENTEDVLTDPPASARQSHETDSPPWKRLSIFSGAKLPPFGKGEPGGILAADHSDKSPSFPLSQRGKHQADFRGRDHRQPSKGEAQTVLPLAGLRVVDLTAFWAGPFATCYLAAMGADVIKVESIQRPDGMRFAGARPGDRMWEWSPVFAGANPGKRDVTLHLDSAEGMGLLRRLIAMADVVIENYSPRVLENFGLGWQAIHALNPKAIMVRMPAFGLDGPWRDRTGFAMTIEQVSGLAWITGYADMPLVVRGACDPIGGMHSVFALFMALEQRRRTGAGRLVEVPLVEVALNVAAEQVIEHSAYGRLLSRQENRGPCAAPQGLYPCADEAEHMALAVPTDDQWKSLCSLMGNPAWASDPSLSTAASRRTRHDEIDRRLEAWLASQPLQAAVDRLLAAGIPASATINAHSLMPNPQLEHRGFFQKIAHPVTGETRYPGFPMWFSGFGRSLHKSPPPTLGQHNDEILGEELGLNPEQLAQLRERQVIGGRPGFM